MIVGVSISKNLYVQFPDFNIYSFVNVTGAAPLIALHFVATFMILVRVTSTSFIIIISSVSNNIYTGVLLLVQTF